MPAKIQLSDAQIEKIKSMRLVKISWDEVAEEVGIPASTLRDRFKGQDPGQDMMICKDEPPKPLEEMTTEELLDWNTRCLLIDIDTARKVTQGPRDQQALSSALANCRKVATANTAAKEAKEEGTDQKSLLDLFGRRRIQDAMKRRKGGA